MGCNPTNKITSARGAASFEFAITCALVLLVSVGVISNIGPAVAGIFQSGADQIEYAFNGDGNFGTGRNSNQGGGTTTSSTRPPDSTDPAGSAEGGK